MLLSEFHCTLNLCWNTWHLWNGADFLEREFNPSTHFFPRIFRWKMSISVKVWKFLLLLWRRKIWHQFGHKYKSVCDNYYGKPNLVASAQRFAAREAQILLSKCFQFLKLHGFLKILLGRYPNLSRKFLSVLIIEAAGKIIIEWGRIRFFRNWQCGMDVCPYWQLMWSRA